MHFVGLKKFCNYKMAVPEVSPQIQPPIRLSFLLFVHHFSSSFIISPLRTSFLLFIHHFSSSFIISLLRSSFLLCVHYVSFSFSISLLRTSFSLFVHLFSLTHVYHTGPDANPLRLGDHAEESAYVRSICSPRTSRDDTTATNDARHDPTSKQPDTTEAEARKVPVFSSLSSRSRTPPKKYHRAPEPLKFQQFSLISQNFREISKSRNNDRRSFSVKCRQSRRPGFGRLLLLRINQI